MCVRARGLPKTIPYFERSRRMSEQDNVAVVRRAYENFKGGDIGGILGSLTEEGDWRLPEIEGVSFSGGGRGRGGGRGLFPPPARSQGGVRFRAPNRRTL